MVSFLFQGEHMEREEAEELLNPWLPGIVKCLTYGISFFQQLQRQNKGLIPLRSCTAASFIYDYTVARAKQVFSGQTPKIACYEDRGLFVLDFYGKILVRFKKFSEDFRIYNVKTNRQEHLSNQLIMTEDLPLASDHAIIVCAGYRFDETGSQIKDMSIVYSYMGSIVWKIPLPYKNEGGVAMQESGGPREPEQYKGVSYLPKQHTKKSKVVGQ